MHRRSHLINLSKSIAPVWSPFKGWALGSVCTWNGLRMKALIDMPPNFDRKFNKNHWEFETVGSGGGGGGRDPITEADIPATYTPDEIRTKVNAILDWARTPVTVETTTTTTRSVETSDEDGSMARGFKKIINRIIPSSWFYSPKSESAAS